MRYKYEDEAQKAVDRLDGAPELLTSGNRCLPSAGCDWIVVHFVRVLFAGRVVDGREIMVMISHLLFLTGVGWIATNSVACSFCSCGEHGKKMKSWAGVLTNP